VAPTLCLVGLLGLPLAARQLPPGLLERAEQGDVEAQTELGSRYYAGRGVDHDDAAAVRWIRRAAELGHAPAEYNLGLLYFRSRGVRGDDVEAAAWYRRAAEQGYAPAQGGLGYMYAYGAGVEEDRVRAVMWLELAWMGADDDFTRRLYAQQRDELAARMHVDEQDEGRRLARARRRRADRGRPCPSSPAPGCRDDEHC
jgi:TPR repeat protein